MELYHLISQVAAKAGLNWGWLILDPALRSCMQVTMKLKMNWLMRPDELRCIKMLSITCQFTGSWVQHGIKRQTGDGLVLLLLFKQHIHSLRVCFWWNVVSGQWKGGCYGCMDDLVIKLIIRRIQTKTHACRRKKKSYLLLSLSQSHIMLRFACTLHCGVFSVFFFFPAPLIYRTLGWISMEGFQPHGSSGSKPRPPEQRIC